MRSTDNRLRTAACALAVLAVTVGTAAAADNQGFLYGRIKTDSGREYTGFLRWGTEEACWDDLFHSAKEDLPYQDEADRLGRGDRGDRADREERDTRRSERRTIRIFNQTITLGDKYAVSIGDASRVFIARFGDIERIEVTGDSDAEVHMKSGSSFAVSGYANDVGGTIQVDDAALGKIDLHWNRIESIEFMAPPPALDREAYRLHGVVETDAGRFEGFIQWDKEECLSTDLLDGDAEDGKVSIPMGQIRSIERRGRSGSIVELRDGRSLRLRDSNDVDADNRGIMVEEPRYGRLTIAWSEFERLTFSDPGPSGRGYDEFPAGRRLRGTVVDTRGHASTGEIVFDLDESEDWEMLNGSSEGIEYDIPFQNVRAIRPTSLDRTEVTLRNGEELRLEDAQDVSDNNDGVLVNPDSKSPTFLEWDEIEEIRLD